MTYYPSATMTLNVEAHEVRDVEITIEDPFCGDTRAITRPTAPIHINTLRWLDRKEARKWIRYCGRKWRRIKRYRALESKWKSEAARFAARLPEALDMTERGYRPKDRLPRGRRQNLRNGPPVSSRDFAEAFG